MPTEIEFLNLKNPTWHIGSVYWTERPDYHFYQLAEYIWNYMPIGFGGRCVVYLPGDTDPYDFARAMNSRSSGFAYRFYAHRYMSPAEVRDCVEAAAACMAPLLKTTLTTT